MNIFYKTIIDHIYRNPKDWTIMDGAYVGPSNIQITIGGGNSIHIKSNGIFWIVPQSHEDHFRRALQSLHVEKNNEKKELQTQQELKIIKLLEQ